MFTPTLTDCSLSLSISVFLLGGRFPHILLGDLDALSESAKNGIRFTLVAKSSLP
jgi:hypothetical protein